MSRHKMASQVCNLQGCLKMASSSGDSRKTKREPGKCCVVMFCNNTNDNGVSLHHFPKDENVCQKWIEFVVRK